MPNFAKKCKKQLRRLFYANVCSCVCSKELKTQSENASVSTDTVVSQKLEVLLLKTLKSQLEEREYHDQLKNTLFQVTQILEQIGKNYDLQEKFSQRFPNDGFSKFTITVSKDRLIHCQTDARKNSLAVLSERSVGVVSKGSSVVLHKCRNDVSGRLIPKGTFSSILYRLSDDKGVQCDPRLSTQSLLRTDSKLIQTQVLNLSNFNVTSFKVNLVQHIRNLKHDVVTLRQLLYSLERYPVSCELNARDLSVFAPNRYFWKEEFECKFREAKVRAANFVTFYKLRKLGSRKKNKDGKRKK